MAFDISRFNSAGGNSLRGKSFQTFNYRTTDSIATVMAAGYFDTVRPILDIGDIIEVVVVDSLTTPTGVSAANKILVSGKATTSPYVTVADYQTSQISGLSDFSGRFLRLPFILNATDLSAGTSQQIPVPVAGTIQRLVITTQVQISTGGVVTLTKNAVAVAGVSITVANSAAVGTVQQVAPTAGDATATVAAADALAVTASAAFNGGGQITGFVEILAADTTSDIFIPFFINATDLSAGTSQYVISPVAGQVIGIHTDVQVAIVTGGAITVQLSDVDVVGLTVTVADAAAVGTVQSDLATDLAGATGTVAKDGAIEIVSAAAFNGGGAINGFVRVRPTNPSSKIYMFWVGDSTDVLAGTSHYISTPAAGNINRASSVVQVAIGTGGNVTFEKGNVALSGLTIVVANSATVGTVNSDTAVFNDITTEFLKDVALEIVFDAAFATTGALWGYAELSPALN